MQGTDSKRRQLLTVYTAHHPQVDVDRLYMKPKHFWERNLEHMSKTHFLMDSVKICRQKTFQVGCFAQIIFCSLSVHYLHVKKCILLRYFSRTSAQNVISLIDVHKLKWKQRWNLSKFVVIKHFGYEFLHVEPSCCLDVVVYTLNCLF